MTSERVVILAGGAWTEADGLGSSLESADYVIAADGGFARATALGIDVDEVVGDLDSLDEGTRGRLAAATGMTVRRYATDKDWTDLELALDTALQRSPAEIVVLGALGGRVDHEMTNVHLLEKGLAAGVPVVLVAGRETIRLTDGDLVLNDAAIGDCVSLVPLSATAVVTTTGLRFSLHQERLERAASRGVSNVVAERSVRITVDGGIVAVIHTRSEGQSDG